MKPKKCKACREVFTPERPLQPACSMKCAITLVNDAKAKKERKATAEKKVSLRSRRDWLKLAQQAFNAYIRARDANKTCICCNVPFAPNQYGGSVDCGHYRSVGSAPHLRYDERNAHGQRKQCNQWGSGRAVDYRIGLIKRIGLEQVEALESDQIPRKYSIEELQEIRETYKAKLRELVRAEKNAAPSFFSLHT